MSQNIVFESSPPQSAPRAEASQIIDALLVDPFVAGDTWVRYAKLRFRELLEPAKPERIEGLTGAAHPLWTAQESACISAHNRATRDQGAYVIGWLVDDLAGQVLRAAGRTEQVPVLIGALAPKLHDLGGGFFNFVLKQQYMVSHER